MTGQDVIIPCGNHSCFVCASPTHCKMCLNDYAVWLSAANINYPWMQLVDYSSHYTWMDLKSKCWLTVCCYNVFDEICYCMSLGHFYGVWRYCSTAFLYYYIYYHNSFFVCYLICCALPCFHLRCWLGVQLSRHWQLWCYPGYAIQDRGVGFNVTAYKPLKDATSFVQSLEASLCDIHNVLDGNMPSKSTW